MANTKQVFLPDIGDFQSVDVIEVLVSPGDRVEPEQSLITLESDKATMEIPAPFGGVVSELKVAVGDRISEGQLIAVLEEAGGAEAPQAPEVPPEPPADAARADEPAAAAPPEAKPAPDADATELKEVHLPDIGDFQDVEIIELLVAPGDQVTEEQSLLTLESEKATMEIPAPFAGQVRELKVEVGQKINQGQLLLLMAVAEPGAKPGAAAADAATDLAQRMEDSAELSPEPTVPTAPRMPVEPARAPGDKLPQPRPVIARPSDAPKGKAHASPAVRRFARELGVDLMQVPGTAAKGRITKEDVQNFVKQALGGAAAPATAAGGPFQLPAVAAVDFSKFGETEEVELGRIKKLSGAHLHRSWLSVPHVTQFDEADVTEVEAFRKGQKAAAEQAGARLTLMPFLIKAVVGCLQAFPQFNASLSPDGQRLILKRYVNIGVAVDTPNGLVVPVLRDADSKGVFEIARELGELSQKARDGKLAPADMQGGCISISSLGGIGGTQFTPIVNAPEVAILGISRADTRPVWDGQGFVPRLIMPFSLSYDHRVIDGAEGVRFTTHLAGLLGDIRRLLL